MDIKKKMAQIIPPNETQYRREFYNSDIIDALSAPEKVEVENGLIDLLFDTPCDILIIDTLLYMNSSKSIKAMAYALGKCQNSLQRIIIASSIFKLGKNDKMIDEAINDFKKLKRKWDLILCFSYLKRFESNKTNAIIEQYVNHREFLIAHNAKRALGLVE